MGEFPIERAREKLGFTPTTAVRAHIDVSTGGQELARAVSGFGGALFNLGIQYDITQAQTELSQFQRKSNEEMNRLALSFDTNLDPETYRKEYDKSVKTINSFVPSNKRAARGAKLWLNEKMPRWERDVDMARLNRADDNWLAEMFEKQQVVAQTGQKGSFPNFVAEGVIAGRIDKSDAFKILAQTNRMAEQGQRNNITTAFHQAAQTMPYDKAISYLNDLEGVTSAERNDLIARRKRQKEIEEAQFTDSNPEVRARVLEELRNPKSEITQDDIEELVGRGLNVDDADRFISRMDVFKSFWFKRIDQRLKNSLQWSNQTLQFLHPEGALAYDLAMDELFAEIEKKGLKEKELYERGVAISVDHIAEYWASGLGIEPERIQKMRRMLEGKPKEFEYPTDYYRSPRFYEDLLKEMRLGKKGVLDPQGIFK